jgi:hypothetical protein
MSRFYFHLRNGADVLLDPEGADLTGIEAIVTRALKEARAILSHEILEGRMGLHQRIDVEDERGMILHSISFGDAVEITR